MINDCTFYVPYAFSYLAVVGATGNAGLESDEQLPRLEKTTGLSDKVR